MQNFELLKEVGGYDKPVLLKRGLSATIKEWLLSAEYIMSRGNKNVMLCERGIRTFESHYRNTLAETLLRLPRFSPAMPQGSGIWSRQWPRRRSRPAPTAF